MFEEKLINTPYWEDVPEESLLKDLIARGEYLRAYDLGDRYLNSVEDPDMGIVKLHALCMSKLGMSYSAIKLLNDIHVGMDGDDPDIPALVGSLYKRRWLELMETDSEGSREALSISFLHYMKSRELGCNYWCTINAASLALFMGKRELAMELADEVINECWENYNRHGTTSDYWIMASMGEAYLIKEDYRTAARWYGSSRSHLQGRLGLIRSARTNAEMLLGFLDPPKSKVTMVLKSVSKPRIAVFAGHRVDRPGRLVPRFPEGISDKIKKQLKKELLQMKPDIGIASAADGSDIIFLECLQEMGRSTHIILPEPVDHFRTRLLASEHERWLERFDNVIRNSRTVETTSSSRFDSQAEGTFRMSADYIVQYSIETAKTFDGELMPLVIWDEKLPGEPGGTGYVVSSFRQLGYEPVKLVIGDQGGARTRSDAETVSETGYPFEEMGIYEPAARPIAVVRPLLENVTEEEVAASLNHLSRRISRLISKHSIRLLSTCIMSSRICLLMDSAMDAWKLCTELRSTSDKEIPCSTVLHGGMIIMLGSDLTGKHDYYSRDIGDAMELSDTLRTSDSFATMQFRSLLRHSLKGESEPDFHYCSVLVTSSGDTLKVFRIPCGDV